MKMPKQTAPIARNLNTTAQAADQNGIEAARLSSSQTGAIGSVAGALIAGAQALKDWIGG